MSSPIMNEILTLVTLIFKMCFLSLKALLVNVKERISPSYADLSEDIVLITGAGSGIGQMMCLKFGPLCAKIVAVDINSQGLDTTKKLFQKLKCRAEFHSYTCDLRSTDEIDGLLTRVETEVGIVSVLVNNAGIVNGKYMFDLSYEEFLNVLRVNLVAHFYLIRKLLPNMLGSAFPRFSRLSRSKKGTKELMELQSKSCVDKTPHGRIVNINSVAGTVPAPALGDYCASKAGAILFSESLREELNWMGVGEHIKVTNIMPYFIDTGMFHGATSSLPHVLQRQSVEGATDQIVSAVRLSKTDVYVSQRFALLPIIKHLLPYEALTRVYKESGSHDMMPNFDGKSDTYLN